MIDHEREPGDAGRRQRDANAMTAAKQPASSPARGKPGSPRRTAAGGGKAPGSAASSANREAGLGVALRTAYQQTVEEDIPAEMLDLLKRLD